MKRQTNALMLFSLVLGGALAGGALLFGGDSLDVSANGDSVPPGRSSKSRDSKSPAVLDLPAASSPRALRVSLSGDVRQAVDAMRATTRWIDGRLEWPAGSPADDSLTVVALGDELPDDEQDPHSDRSWHEREVVARASVASDGAFRLPLPKGVDDEELELDVDGRFLYLDELQPLLGYETDGSLVLHAELGASIRGQLQLPYGADEIPAEVEVGCHGLDYRGSNMMRRTIIENTLEFELRALQPGLRYSLWASPGIYPGLYVDDELIVEPGQRARVTLELELGATVRGQVVDSSGAPVPGAEVGGDTNNAYSMRPDVGKVLSDDEGRFELRGLAVGTQTLKVAAPEYLTRETDELALAAGDVVEDLSVVLDIGEELTGSVRWPNGDAAVGAKLTLLPADLSGDGWRFYELARSDEGSARSDDDGSFSVSGLPPGEYGLYAELAGRDGDSGVWNARLDVIEAGATDVELVLGAPLACFGRVLDDAGQEIDSFTVTIKRLDWPGWIEGSSAVREETLRDAAGSFEIGGLDAGAWKVSIRADGHLPLHDQPVTVPSQEPATFSLTRAASISGVVLDPNGVPVAGVEVSGQSEDYEGLSDRVDTDEEGRFTLSAVGPGPVLLDADCLEWAPSEQARLDLQPGDDLRNETVYLTHGGSISGVVFDAEGALDADRMILIQSNQGHMREATSDEEGRFLAEHLAPGPYQVIATPDEDVWMTPGANEGDMGDLFEQLSMGMAVVVELETVEIVLGAPPLAPVLVHGTVLRAGEPVPNANVLVLSESGNIIAGMRADTAGEDGSYEVKLDEPGNYTFVLAPSEHLPEQVDFQLTIPEVERFELDLELPGGSIAGRVIAGDGGAPESALVWVRREDGTSDVSTLMARSSIQLEDDGTFLLEALHAGTYAVSATGDEDGMMTVHGIVVADGEQTSGVDIVLAKSGRVTGTVVDDGGNPVPGAFVHVRDGEGRPLYELVSMTDGDGVFTITRIPAGEALLSARTDTHVAGEQALSVVAGEESRIDFTLEAGVVLLVELEDDEGRLVRGSIRAVNEAGHDFAGLAGYEELQRVYTEGAPTGARRVGPLLPGSYTLYVQSEDGLSSEASVSIKSDETGEREVRLRLDG